MTPDKVKISYFCLLDTLSSKLFERYDNVVPSTNTTTKVALNCNIFTDLLLLADKILQLVISFPSLHACCSFTKECFISLLLTVLFTSNILLVDSFFFFFLRIACG